jgi:phosphate transport system protein
MTESINLAPMGHFHQKLAELRSLLLRMGGAVEEQLRRATEALLQGDHAKARYAIASDRDIDRLELEIDEACIQLLALHQPAAADLRFVVATMKVVTDLERIGDQAVNIARSTLEPRTDRGLPERLLGRMAVDARLLVTDSLDALARLDTALARRVIAEDAALDELERETMGRVLRLAARDPDHLPSIFRLAYVARCLERVGDHATNVAEMVVYIADATLALHRSAVSRTETSSKRADRVQQLLELGRDPAQLLAMDLG